MEAEFFEDEDAFEEMLATEDDLIDAYARGELTAEERRKFEKSFVSSLHGRNRVQFARAFASAVSVTPSVEPKLPGSLPNIFKAFQWPSLLRTTMAAVIVLAAVLTCLLIDRRRMTDELRELRAQSAELSKQTAALQQSSDIAQTRTGEIAAELAAPRAQSDKPRHRKRGNTETQRARYLPGVKNNRTKFAMNRAKPEESLNNVSAVSRKIISPSLEPQAIPNLLELQRATTRDGYVAGGRSDQQGARLDGVDAKPFNTESFVPRNMSSSGGTIVYGIARDPQGNIVSGATVTLTDSARNLTRTQSTNENGAYVFKAIPPGTYSLEVRAPGFKTVAYSGLATLTNTPTVRDVHLEVGAISERVNVPSAAAPSVNTSDATVGNSFERKVIIELPLNVNNVVGLLTLQPGVTPKDSVNGGRADQPTITFDGIDATVRIPGSFSWIRFQMALERAAIHEDYRVTIETAGGRPVTSVDWIEPLTPNQTIIDTPAISTGDLPSGDYVLLLMGREPDGSFVKVAECSFKFIKY